MIQNLHLFKLRRKHLHQNISHTKMGQNLKKLMKCLVSTIIDERQEERKRKREEGRNWDGINPMEAGLEKGRVTHMNCVHIIITSFGHLPIYALHFVITQKGYGDGGAPITLIRSHVDTKKKDCVFVCLWLQIKIALSLCVCDGRHTLTHKQWSSVTWVPFFLL